MITCKADNHSRVKLPDVKPGTIFKLTNAGAGHFTLVEVLDETQEQVAEVKPVKGKDGLYSWPVELSREEVLKLVKAAKESR